METKKIKLAITEDHLKKISDYFGSVTTAQKRWILPHEAEEIFWGDGSIFKPLPKSSFLQLYCTWLDSAIKLIKEQMEKNNNKNIH